MKHAGAGTDREAPGLMIDAEFEMESHVTALEAAWIEPSTAALPELVEILTERQRHLDALQAVDASGLSPDIRETLNNRLRDVLERDAQLWAKVRELKESLAKAGHELRQTRRSADGYRRVAKAIGPGLERIA